MVVLAYGTSSLAYCVRIKVMIVNAKLARVKLIYSSAKLRTVRRLAV
jgi:hypothetical protein